MSRLHFRVFTNFFTHRKTAKLRAKIGDSALWVPPRLWAYAVENQPDGDFSAYDPGELAVLIGYTGDATRMLQALLEAGYLDENPLRLHDWAEHNGYHASYSERAKKAATARWAKRGEASPSPIPLSSEEKEKERGKGDKQCLEHPPKLFPSEEGRLIDELRQVYASIALSEPGKWQEVYGRITEHEMNRFGVVRTKPRTEIDTNPKLYDIRTQIKEAESEPDVQKREKRIDNLRYEERTIIGQLESADDDLCSKIREGTDKAPKKEPKTLLDKEIERLCRP